MRQRIAAVLELSIVIAKSDLIILVISSSLLGVAVYRWDQNTRNVDTSTVLANTRAETVNVRSQDDIETNLVATTADEPNSNTLVLDSNVGSGNAETTSLPTIIESAPIEPIEPSRPFLIHVVRSGDSLSEIAVRYNTTVQALRDANAINGSTIFIGQEILYPAN